MSLPTKMQFHLGADAPGGSFPIFHPNSPLLPPRWSRETRSHSLPRLLSQPQRRLDLRSAGFASRLAFGASLLHSGDQFLDCLLDRAGFLRFLLRGLTR